MIPLSVLDHSPRGADMSTADALEASLDLARAADRLGYRRYWLAEHHRDPALAGAAPEVLAAAVGAVTSRLRIGSGGVLLPYYAPLKVAETFGVLSALYPGRVDLGIGRAPGADPASARALGSRPAVSFPSLAGELLTWLSASGDTPAALGPQVWVLGSSPSSAAVAAALGAPYCYAHFIAPEGAARALTTYRDAFCARPGGPPAPRTMCAVLGLCAPSAHEARFHAASTWRWGYDSGRGIGRPVPRPEEVLADPWARRMHDEILSDDPRLFVDDAPGLAGRLELFAGAVGADELMVATIVAEPAVRRVSYELLAVACGQRAGAGATAVA